MSSLDDEYSAEEDEPEEIFPADDAWSDRDRSAETPMALVPAVTVVPKERKPTSINRGRSTANEKQIKWAVKALKDWCTVEEIATSFEELPPQELNKMLARFYQNARRKDGNEFSKAGFGNIRKCLDSYLRAEPYSLRFSILKDQEFAEANKSYDLKLAQLELVGTSPWRHPTSMSPHDICKLLESGVFSPSQPLGLLRTCWFNITLHFDVGDHLKQRKLIKSQFVFKTNSSGIEYVKMANTSSALHQLMRSTAKEDEVGPIMFSIRAHPLCPVTLLRKYFSKTQPDFEAVYQMPVAYPVDEGVPIWYEKQAVGIHQLEGMMSRISRDAHLSRTYLNSSLKATSPLVYVQCGFGQSYQNPTTAQNSRSAISMAASSQGGRCSPLGTTSPGAHPHEAKVFSFSPASTSGPSQVAYRSSYHLPSPGHPSSGMMAEASVSSVPGPWSPSELVPRDSVDSPAGFSNESVNSGEGQLSPKIEAVSGSAMVSLPANCTTITLSDAAEAHSAGSEYSADSPLVGSSAQFSIPSSIKPFDYNPSVSVSGSGPARGSVARGWVSPQPQSFSTQAARSIKVERPADSCCRVSTAEHLVPGKMYLHLQVLEGKSFLDQAELGSTGAAESTVTVTLHIHLQGQRCKSQPVQCAYDLALREDFYLELETDCFAIPDKVHFVLTREENGQRVLIGTSYLEWQSAFEGPTKSSVEISGVGTEAKMMVGAVDVRLEIVTPLAKTAPQGDIRSQLTLSRCKRSDRDRRFMQYARQWWKEYSSCCKRPVKIFAQDECGISRPVFSYIQPLQAGRLLESPRQAARFVSLLGVEEESSMWGAKTETWTTLHTFLCRRKGSSEDHAVLLCSLFLGFGLDTYVCSGTKEDGSAHAWVMTQRPNGSITFWDSLTGERLPFSPGELKCPYRGVICVFNHQSFYANIQPSDSLESCSLYLLDGEAWKAMSEEAIEAVHGEGLSPPVPVPSPLSPPDIDSHTVTEQLEVEMKTLVMQHRQNLSLGLSWDDSLSYRLAPALVHEDSDIQTAAELDEFKEAILRIVPLGSSFQSFAIRFNHCDSRQAFQQCLAEHGSVIGCQGNDVTFAIRARVSVYPENACSSWLMFAVRYRNNDGSVVNEWHI